MGTLFECRRDWKTLGLFGQISVPKPSLQLHPVRSDVWIWRSERGQRRLQENKRRWYRHPSHGRFIDLIKSSFDIHIASCILKGGYEVRNCCLLHQRVPFGGFCRPQPDLTICGCFGTSDGSQRHRHRRDRT